MESNRYASLRLENQLCFPLYACAKEVVRRYKPFLDKLDLTYTQYLAMMAMWEYEEMTVTDLGRALYLDSGTMTPLIKKLVQKGFVERRKKSGDERTVLITITEKGRHLQEEALSVPQQMQACIAIPQEEAMQLYQSLHKLLSQF